MHADAGPHIPSSRLLRHSMIAMPGHAVLFTAALLVSIGGVASQSTGFISIANGSFVEASTCKSFIPIGWNRHAALR